MASHRWVSRTGIALLVVGLLVPIVTQVVVRLWIYSLPQVPPNQGAMVVAYFATLGSLAIGLAGLVAGGLLLLVPRFLRARTEHPT